MPPLPENLERLRAECEVEFTRGSGPGGQHRNVTESAVRLRHLPTGLVAQASERRSQRRNLTLALERLAEKLAARARRRKPRVPTRATRASKEERIQAKKVRAEKKKMRTKIERD